MKKGKAALKGGAKGGKGEDIFEEEPLDVYEVFLEELQNEEFAVIEDVFDQILANFKNRLDDKELDMKKGPHAIKNIFSCILKTAEQCLFKYDKREDDIHLDGMDEPVSLRSDNFLPMFCEINRRTLEIP